MSSARPRAPSLPTATQVQLLAARIPVIGPFADHHWLVVRRGQRTERWEVWQRADAGGDSWGHVHRNLLPPYSGVGNGPCRCLWHWSGAPADQLAERLARCPTVYPWRQRYRYWPGPNSNTFVQWVLGDLRRLPWKALGKHYARLAPAQVR